MLVVLELAVLQEMLQLEIKVLQVLQVVLDYHHNTVLHMAVMALQVL
jgi:hypothetical protein